MSGAALIKLPATQTLTFLLCRTRDSAYFAGFCGRLTRSKRPGPTHFQPWTIGGWDQRPAAGGGAGRGPHLQKVCRHSRSTTASPGASTE